MPVGSVSTRFSARAAPSGATGAGSNSTRDQCGKRRSRSPHAVRIANDFLHYSETVRLNRVSFASITLAVTIVLIVAALASLTGCSRIHVRTKHDESFNFGTLRVYQWTAGGSRSVTDPRIDRDFLDRQVRSVADRELTAKGFSSTPGAEPDFLVSYHTVIQTRSDDSSANEPHGYTSGWWGPGDDTGPRPADAGPAGGVEYQEGTLVIGVLEPGSQRLLWRGSAKTEVFLSNSPDQRAARINRAVVKILDRFPP